MIVTSPRRRPGLRRAMHFYAWAPVMQLGHGKMNADPIRPRPNGCRRIDPQRPVRLRGGPEPRPARRVELLDDRLHIACRLVRCHAAATAVTAHDQPRRQGQAHCTASSTPGSRQNDFSGHPNSGQFPSAKRNPLVRSRPFRAGGRQTTIRYMPQDTPPCSAARPAATTCRSTKWPLPSTPSCAATGAGRADWPVADRAGRQGRNGRRNRRRRLRHARAT